jgi:hypothetical protein
MPATLVKFLRFPAGQLLIDLRTLCSIAKVKVWVGENATDTELSDEHIVEADIRRIVLLSEFDDSVTMAQVRPNGMQVRSQASGLVDQVPYLALLELLRQRQSRVLVMARKAARYVALSSASFAAAMTIARAASDPLRAEYARILFRLAGVLLFGSLGILGATILMEKVRFLPDQPSWLERVRDPLSVALIAAVFAAILNLIMTKLT